MDTMTRAAKVSRIQAQGGARQGRLLGKLLPLLPVLLAGLVGTGCSSVRAMDAPRPAEVVVAPSVAAPPPPGYTFYDQAASAAPAPPSGSRERSAQSETRTVTPQRRPGLGTEWGEERESPIEDVAFVRADERAPLATTDLRYDDERGVEALMAQVPTAPPRLHEARAVSGAISLWLKDGRDRPLDVVELPGRTFVIGEAGERYTIVLQNHTGHRFEAVTTVDGLDVINGKAGSVGNRGYLLMPYATLEIDGFRQTEQTVAAFRFGRTGDAYAAQVGSGRDIGVIGIAFFGEAGDRWRSWVPAGSDLDSEARRRTTASPFPADTRFAPPPPRW